MGRQGCSLLLLPLSLPLPLPLPLLLLLLLLLLVVFDSLFARAEVDVGLYV